MASQGAGKAANCINNAGRFDYNANGNMAARNKGLPSWHTLAWDAENHLSHKQESQGILVEQYWYGVGGAHVKKTSGHITTYAFFVYYEEKVTGGVTTAISYYSFGGLRITVKRGADLFRPHNNHLVGTSLTTGLSAEIASRTNYAFGAERAAPGDLQTGRTFTIQGDSRSSPAVQAAPVF